MNARMKDALDEALLLSNKIIQDLVEQILAYSGALYTASEAVAIVDLLWSFAHASISKSLFLSQILLVTMISEKLRAPGIHWDICCEGRKAPNSRDRSSSRNSSAERHLLLRFISFPDHPGAKVSGEHLLPYTSKRRRPSMSGKYL